MDARHSTQAMNMDSLLQDIRFGFRMLVKARGFTAACVLTLALGIGCATTMFSLFEGPILNRPPVRDLDRIAQRMGRQPADGDGSWSFFRP